MKNALLIWVGINDLLTAVSSLAVMITTIVVFFPAGFVTVLVMLFFIMGAWSAATFAFMIFTGRFVHGFFLAFIALIFMQASFFPDGDKPSVMDSVHTEPEMVQYYANTCPLNDIFDSKDDNYLDLVKRDIENSWIDYSNAFDDGKYSQDKFHEQWDKSVVWFAAHDYPAEKPPVGLIPQYLGNSDQVKNGGLRYSTER